LSDARTGRRFPLTLAVKIKDGDSRRSHAANTGNLSAAGVYISTNLPFRKGSKLNFQITLPAPIIGSNNDVEVNCVGRVVRVDAKASGKRRGVACVIDRYEFVPQRKPRGGK
jgi:PilZ domain